MQNVLLAAAAGLALAAASGASAESRGGSGQGFTGASGRPTASTGRWDGGGDGGGMDHRRRGHRDDGTVIIGDWGDGDWARYNNRTFDADSYNDWWHERPWRSYPRWVSSGTCDRLWWGGGTWRCTW